VSFRVVMPRVSASLATGLPAGAVVSGVRVVPIGVTAQPRATAVSVGARLDGQSIAVQGGPPWSVRIDGRSLAVGPHQLVVTTSLPGGQTSTATSRFEVTHPRYFVTYVAPGSTRLDRPRRFTPTIVDEEGIGVTRVGYEVGGRPVAGAGPDNHLDLDPRQLDPGALRLVTRVIRRDGSRAETTLDLVVVRPPELNLFVTARRTGRLLPPPELDGIGLSVELDDRPVPVADVGRTPATAVPLAFSLVLDCSGSMQDEEKFPRAVEAAGYFIELKRAGDAAALIAFSDAVRVVCNLEPSRMQLREKLALLSPQGATALYDGIVAGVKELSRGRERRAVFVLSDGVDQDRTGTGPGSRATLDEAIEAAREAGAAIYTIGLGPEQRARGAVGERVLVRLARASGGVYAYAPGASALSAIFKGFSEQVQSQTHLRIQSADLVSGRTYRVRLKAAADGVELVYPTDATARDAAGAR
jgi:VWFA-related protein